MDPTPNLEDQIVLALRRITRAIDLRSRDLFHFHGLTAPQLAVLRVIGACPAVTPGEIARMVHLSQPTITGILARLAQRGLIEKSRGDRDKRSQHLSLNAAGRQLLDSAPSPLQETFRQELSQLRDWERTQILSTLQRVADMMQCPAKEIFEVQTSTTEASMMAEESAVGASAHSPWMEVPPSTP